MSKDKSETVPALFAKWGADFSEFLLVHDTLSMPFPPQVV